LEVPHKKQRRKKHRQNPRHSPQEPRYAFHQRKATTSRGSDVVAVKLAREEEVLQQQQQQL
jgi:hypothetical protein